MAGGADTVDHLASGEGGCRVHTQILGAGTDSLEGLFENVEAKFEVSETATTRVEGSDRNPTEGPGNTSANTDQRDHSSR